MSQKTSNTDALTNSLLKSDPIDYKMEISCRLVKPILLYIEERFGREQLHRFINNIDLDLDYLGEQHNWISWNCFQKILNSLVEFTQNPNSPFEAGTYSIKKESYGILEHLFARFGNPSAAYKLIAQSTHLYTKVGEYKISKLTRNSCIISLSLLEGFSQTELGCLNAQGTFAAIPKYWGLPFAVVKHDTCYAKGDNSCVYKITWKNRPSVLLSLFGSLCGTAILAMDDVARNSFFSYNLFYFIIPLLGFFIGRHFDIRRTRRENSTITEKQSNDLMDSIKKIETLNQELQIKVDNRTRELYESNKELSNTLEELDKTNKELKLLSITDGLTGLYNHRYIQDRLDFEFKRVKRYGGLLSCMLIDIDHFKMINDTYGHQFGDYVLAELGKIIKRNSRDVDISSRYGGEEFMVLSNQTADGALKFAAKIQKAIENHHFEYDGQSTNVYVSIGIADLQNDIDIKQKLIERADTSLYRAKREGRNLIRVWKETDIIDEIEIDFSSVQELKSEFMHLSSQVRASYMESTNALIRAIDARDHYTHEHSVHVSKYAVNIANKLKLPENEIEIIKYAGLLHDIGKIGIQEEVLVKKSKLTDKEFSLIKKHSVIGANIIKDVKFLEKEYPIVLHHHERWDGAGYPHGLKGREIPLGARILSVADAFDAMTTDREYRPKLSLTQAIDEIKNGKNNQFDSEIAEVFLKLLHVE